MVLPEVTTLAEARDAIRDLAEENEKLSNELAWFRRQLFGSKTEHYIPRDDTPSLFPEEMSPESPKEVLTATVAEHERKVRQANALSEIPADLPREERVIDVPEEEREGMILIGYDESERIAYRTGLYVIHFKRAKYADPSDTLRGVVTAPAPGDVFDSVSGRTRYDASFIAKVVADKVENAIPLERQARMFGNERLPVAPSTLEDLYKRTADALLPLYERMVDRIMQCDILHVDETFIKQLVKAQDLQLRFEHSLFQYRAQYPTAIGAAAFFRILQPCPFVSRLRNFSDSGGQADRTARRRCDSNCARFPALLRPLS